MKKKNINRSSFGISAGLALALMVTLTACPTSTGGGGGDGGGGSGSGTSNTPTTYGGTYYGAAIKDLGNYNYTYEALELTATMTVGLTAGKDGYSSYTGSGPYTVKIYDGKTDGGTIYSKGTVTMDMSLLTFTGAGSYPSFNGANNAPQVLQNGDGSVYIEYQNGGNSHVSTHSVKQGATFPNGTWKSTEDNGSYMTVKIDGVNYKTTFTGTKYQSYGIPNGTISEGTLFAINDFRDLAINGSGQITPGDTFISQKFLTINGKPESSNFIAKIEFSEQQDESYSFKQYMPGGSISETLTKQ